MLKKVPIIIALIALGINLLLAGEHMGYERGYEYTTRLYAKWSFSGGTAYGSLGQYYFSSSTFLLMFVIGRLIKKEVVSQFICTFSLIWIIRSYIFIFQQKYYVSKELDDFYILITETLSLDWFCFSIISALLSIQLFTISKLLYQTYKATPK